MDTELQEQLYQEHLLLTDTFERSGYDAVGKMETTMVEITALLNQFSQLIANQEEDVLLLHEQTKTAKTYVESGQNKLVDAAERGKKSQHLMATFIVFLALLLLFLHWIFP
jgi:t-SNARE complex subunit (syntaxin)